MIKYKVMVDKKKCIGCGACTAICDNFELVDGKAEVVNEEVNEIGCNNDAKNVCPTDAIIIRKIK